jgi:cobalt-zinc-cadmium efflux system membrane fusion protein
MSMNRYKIFTLAVVLAAAGTTLQSCTHHAPEEQKEEKFQVTDTLLNSLLMDTVQEGNAQGVITLTGSVAPDENKMVKVFPLVSGVAGDVRINLGDVVSKGQTLAILKSAEVAGFSKDVVAADADVRNARRVYQSQQDLFKSGLASQKDVEQAQADLQKAQAESRRANAVIGINQSNGQGYELKTPISGYVVDKNLTNGMQVRTDNSEPLFTIADLSDVYVLINIYESDISSVQTGDKVNITTLSYPDKVFTGQVDKIYNMLDADDKVMKARVRIPNPGALLKPQMFANVRIQSKSGESLPVVSTRGVIFDNDRNYVIVADGKAHVRIQPITIAKRVEDKAYISAGLKPGERVVASRQLYLYESLKD